jgi:hypothetical protein
MARKALQKRRITKPIAMLDPLAVTAALALASPSITTERQAAALFAPIARGRGKPTTTDWETFDLTSFQEFFATDDWENAQALVRKWVPQIAHYDQLSEKRRAQLRDEVNEIAESGYAFVMRLGPQGLESASERDSIESACIRAFVPFFIPNGWSPHRLGQCQHKPCGAWFLRPEAKRGSVPLYCSKRHANSARVSAFRHRQEAHQ